LADLYGADPTRVEVVTPGVDRSIFHDRGRLEERAALGLAGRRVLLFAGRIQPLKGADLAVRCLAELQRPEVMLLIVGGPSGAEGDAELAALHALVDALGLAEQVRFVPAVQHHELARYYRAADVCVVPSRSESFGLVALEAAACGTPVVAADVGGLRTLVEHARTGFLVDGRDPALYASFVAELLDDEQVAAEMGLAARDRSQRYSWSITAARLRRLYGDLAARGLVRCR
jgi:D-inositol-3-phosphate glycosyltransferase